MAKNKTVAKYIKSKYNPEESFNKLLKQYNLSNLLSYTCVFSSKILEESYSSNYKGVIISDYNFINKKIGPINAQTYIQAWNLIDISFHSVLSCRNYKGKNIDSINEYVFICAAWNEITGKYNGGIHDNGKPIVYDLMTFLFGIFGEQKLYQSLPIVVSSINRDSYILNKIAPNVDYEIKDFNLDRVIQNQLGVNQTQLLVSLFILPLLASKDPDISKLLDIIPWNSTFTKDSFINVINYYKTNLDNVRNSEQGRQIFYSKPLVEIDNSLILINVYIPYFIYSHSLLWIARDFYKPKGQLFTNFYGKCFESYFEEIVYEYVETTNITKLTEENKAKQADWLIKLGDYNLLIEQKSSPISLECKHQNPNIESYKNYLRKTIIKAMKQLNSSESKFDGSQTYYKVILLYEDYVVPELIDYIFEDENCNIINDHRFWIVSIGEMEELLFMYKNNINSFVALMKEKIHLESINSKEGRSVEYLLTKFNWKINHIVKDKYKETSIKVNDEINRITNIINNKII